VLYVATATAMDEEMAKRIAYHRAQRPASWRTVESPTDLVASIDLGDGATVLVEDLTLLLSNHMESGDSDGAEAATLREIEALVELDAHVILVSNEVGMGLVPPYPLGRVFRDALGRVNQRAAALCSEAYLMVAGLPLRLK
jgi:adenosylcobinamide kinase/adenosylcobinamide-phosphate guanylyltransferase